MSSTQNEGQELLLTGLRNQHAVENQALALLNRQLERLENYPQMAQRMHQHVAETTAQIQRLEEMLSALGSSHSAMKDAAMSFTGNMAAIMHTVAPDEVLKNTLANYAFEHFEIASYKSLITIADTVAPASVSALRQSLSEEVSMASWIDDHLADTTLRYLQRRQAGVTAGV